MIRWPWKSKSASATRLAISVGDEEFHFVQAAGRQILRSGTARRGRDTPQQFARRVRPLELPGTDVVNVLDLSECQLLQIDAPAVPDNEIKAAARWRIKDMVETPVDELAIDVLEVGAPRPGQRHQLYVAAAQNSRMLQVGEWMSGAGLRPTVFDIAELAQRNLQCALSEQQGRPGEVSAALVRHGAQCLLTICAQGELFYCRRLEWSVKSIDTTPSLAVLAAAAVSKTRGLMSAELEGVDMIDYGAEEEDVRPAATESVSRLALEVQRSLDIWERSWPDLPLDRLWVDAGSQTADFRALLERTLSLPVEALDAWGLFEGASAATDEPIPLTLLGGLLRQEARAA